MQYKILLTVLSLLILPSIKVNAKDLYLKGVNEKNINKCRPEVQMYFYIKKYAKQYGIPIDYAFAIAYQETRYQGPNHKNYKHNQVSKAGALGPMQIMPKTADWLHKKKVSPKKLKNNIAFNVKTSMIVLKRLYGVYHNWGVVFGWYNTGYPIVNKYAKNVLNKKYIWKKDKEFGIAYN